MVNKADSAEKVVEIKQGQSAEPDVRPARKGIYLLPNLLTTGALFGGFTQYYRGLAGSMNGLLWQFLLLCYLMALMVVLLV